MRNSKVNKFICLLMVFTMLFTMMPTSVFGATQLGDQNGAGSHTDQNEGSALM